MQIALGLSTTLSQGLGLPGIVAAPLSIIYGPDPTYTGPTTGDYFVATDGDDSNDGLSTATPFATLQEAIDTADAAGGSQTIVMRGGNYPQTATLAGTTADIEIVRYGAELPVVTGADALTGWVACTISDEPEVGADWVNMHKTTITLADLEHGDRALLNLYEDGERCDIAQDRLTDTSPHAWGDDATYHLGTFNLNGSDEILSITDTTVLAAYTEDQARDLTVMFYNSDNRADPTTFDTFNESTSTGVLADQTKQEHPDGVSRHVYSLANSTKAITQGRWACRDDNNGTTATVYFWPNDAANLVANIEYSTRTHGIDLGDAQGNIAIRGVDIIRGCDNGLTCTGFGCRTNASTDKAGSVTLEHCNFGRTTGDNYGTVYLRQILGGVTIRNCDITETNDHGMMISVCDGVEVDQTTYHKVAGTPFRSFTNLNLIWSFCHLTDVARNSHANLFPFYQFGDNLLAYGLYVRDTFGYFAWSTSSQITVAFCDIEVNGTPTDNRALVNQNGGGDPPVFGSRIYLYNNGLRPNNPAIQGTSIAMGSTNFGDEDYTVLNNIADGISDSPGIIDDQRGNIFTELSLTQAPENLIASEEYQSALEFYVDPYTGVWTQREDAIGRGRVGVDLTATIAAIQARHPSFTHLNKDINGEVFTATAPPVGPEVTLDAAPVEPVHPYGAISFTASEYFDLGEHLGWEDIDGFTLAMRVTRPTGSSGNVWFATNLLNTYVMVLGGGNMRVKVDSRSGSDLYLNTNIDIGGWAVGETKSLVLSANATTCQIWVDGTLEVDETALTDVGTLRTVTRLNSTDPDGADANDFDLHGLWYASEYIDAATAGAALFDGSYLPTTTLQAGSAVSGVEPQFFEARTLGWPLRAGWREVVTPITVSSPIADQTVTQDAGDVTIDLDTVFADADSYAVSGDAAASVSGSTLTISDDAVVSTTAITVTASATGTPDVTDVFDLTITAAAPTNLLPFDTFEAADWAGVDAGVTFVSGELDWSSTADNGDQMDTIQASRGVVSPSTTYEFSVDVTDLTADGSFRIQMYPENAAGTSTGSAHTLLNAAFGSTGVKTYTFTTGATTERVRVLFRQISAQGAVDITLADPRLVAV